MRILIILLFSSLCISCAANTQSLSSHYSNYVGGEFELTEDMALYQQSEGNFSFYNVSLVRQSDCCHQGRLIANLPEGTKITVDDVLRYTFFTNDCNEAIGKINFDDKLIKFEFFINCNYEGLKISKSLPWGKSIA